METTDKNEPPALPVRWAILGTGAIATAFAEDIRFTKNARLTAVCSRTSDAATAFSQRFGGLRVIADVDDLSADPQVDAVYIATPNSTHFDQAKFLLGAGKPVLIEKPLVTAALQARSLADLSAHQQCFAMEGLWTLFLPAVDRVRALLASGTIGSVIAVRAELAYVKPFDGNSRFFSKALGGGSLLDLGIYPIALTLGLFGPPAAVSGQWHAAPSGVDISADIKLGYSGFNASLSCGFDRDGSNRFVIEGTTGSLVIDAPFLKASRVFLTRNGMVHGLVIPPGSGRLSRMIGRVARSLPLPGLTVYEDRFPGNGLQFEIEAASKAIQNGEHQQSRMPLSASAEALGIIETILGQPAS